MEVEKIKATLIEVLETIFKQIEVSAVIDFPEEKNNSEQIYVNISTEEPNILIGFHGETINSIQHLASTILYKKFQEKCPLVIDVEGYREERAEKLREVAQNASEKARFLGKPIALYPMNSYERKIIHEKVSEIDGVMSESEGEGKNRRVIIKPVSAKQTE